MNQTETPDVVTEQKKRRFDYIDQLKGIAIFFVVLGHFVQFNVHNFEQNKLYSFIYSFHMPLFMFLSGYIAQKTTKPAIFQSYGSFLRKKAITLLIPFFSWPLLIIPFIFGNRNAFNPLQTAAGLVTDPGGGLWYLWFLFFLYIFYSLFLFIATRVNTKNNFITDCIFCGLIALPLLILAYLHIIEYVHIFLLYYLFFFLGVFVSKYLFIRAFLMNNLVFSAALVSFLILGMLYRYDDEGGVNKIIKIAAATSAIASFYYIANEIRWNPFINKVITGWGKNSLAIYVTQAPILVFFTFPASFISNQPLVFLLTGIICSLTIILICLGISKIVELSKLLNLIFYGKM